MVPLNEIHEKDSQVEKKAKNSELFTMKKMRSKSEKSFREIMNTNEILLIIR